MPSPTNPERAIDRSPKRSTNSRRIGLAGLLVAGAALAATSTATAWIQDDVELIVLTPYNDGSPTITSGYGRGTGADSDGNFALTGDF